MDPVSRAALEYVCKISSPGAPAVADVDEFKKEADASVSAATIKELALNGFIKLKYSDGENFCLEPQEKGTALILAARAEATEAAGNKKPTAVPDAKKSFLYGFLGGVFGGALAVIIAAAVYVIIKLV